MPAVPRVVLDSNVVVDGLLRRRNASSHIMRSLFEGKLVAVVTLEVLAEYQMALRSRSVREAADRVGLSQEIISLYAEAVGEVVELVDAGIRFRCADPDDEKFTAASTGGHADFIVTADAALLDLGDVLEARVVTPDQFVETIE